METPHGEEHDYHFCSGVRIFKYYVPMNYENISSVQNFTTTNETVILSHQCYIKGSVGSSH